MQCSYVFDLNTAIPFADMPEDQRKEIWDDPVHFTSKGYDLMGKLIAERIMEVIQKSEVKEEAPKETKGELKKRATETEGRQLRSGKILAREVAAR